MMSGLGMRSPRTGALLWLLVTVMAIGSGLQKNSVVVDGALGVNWGTISNNPLPPGYVAQMLRASNLTKVKIFDSDFSVIRSMAGEDIEVMVAAPNDLLAELASDPSVAVDWVTQNITQFLFTPGGVNIKYVDFSLSLSLSLSVFSLSWRKEVPSGFLNPSIFLKFSLKKTLTRSLHRACPHPPTSRFHQGKSIR